MTDYDKMALEWIAGDDGYGGGKFTVADLAALLRRVADEQRERDAKIAEEFVPLGVYQAHESGQSIADEIREQETA